MRVSRSVAATAVAAACLIFAPPVAQAQQKSPLPVVTPDKVGLSAERLARTEPIRVTYSHLITSLVLSSIVD